MKSFWPPFKLCDEAAGFIGESCSELHVYGLQSAPSVPSMLDGSSPLSGTSPELSRHQSGWTDILDHAARDHQQPGSPTDSVRSTLETFDEYLANLPHSQSYPSPKFLGLEGHSRQHSGAVDGPEAGSPLIATSDDDVPLGPEARQRLSYDGLSSLPFPVMTISCVMTRRRLACCACGIASCALPPCCEEGFA